MRLAAAKVRLQLNYRITAAFAEALDRGNEQAIKAVRQEGASKELHRVPVLIYPLSEVDLPEIGRELGLLVLATGHILVWGNDFAPGLKGSPSRALDYRARTLPPFDPNLLVEDQPSQLHLHLADFVGLGSGDRGQEPYGGIKCSIGVITRECLLMRPLIAVVAQLADETPLRRTQGAAKHIVPCRPHELEQRGDVPIRQRPVRKQAIVAHEHRDLRRGLCAIRVLQLPLDERSQPSLEELHRFADALVARDRHLLYPAAEQLRLRFPWLPTFLSKPRNFGPALHQSVIGECFGRALLALANDVKPVGEFARGVRL